MRILALPIDNPFFAAQIVLAAAIAKAGVNRRAILTPDRRPKLTPREQAEAVALAPAELVRVAQPGRARKVKRGF